MPGNCKLWLNIFSTALGLLLGISACIVFGLYYNNVHASVWGFTSAVFAAVSLHLHILHLQQKLISWHSFETLRGLKLLGFITFLCGLAGMSWYIFITFYKHVPLMPVSTSTVVSSVMSFMTGKWGIYLYFSAHHYTIHVVISDDPLLT